MQDERFAIEFALEHPLRQRRIQVGSVAREPVCQRLYQRAADIMATLIDKLSNLHDGRQNRSVLVNMAVAGWEHGLSHPAVLFIEMGSDMRQQFVHQRCLVIVYRDLAGHFESCSCPLGGSNFSKGPLCKGRLQQPPSSSPGGEVLVRRCPRLAIVAGPGTTRPEFKGTLGLVSPVRGGGGGVQVIQP